MRLHAHRIVDIYRNKIICTIINYIIMFVIWKSKCDD